MVNPYRPDERLSGSSTLDTMACSSLIHDTEKDPVPEGVRSIDPLKGAAHAVLADVVKVKEGAMVFSIIS